MPDNSLSRRVLVVGASPERLDALVGDISHLLACAGVAVREMRPDEAPVPWCGPQGPLAAGAEEDGPLAPVAGVTVQVGDLVVCADARIARRAGEDLDLTRIEFDLLVEFLRHRNRVLTKQALLGSVWHHEPVTPNAIEARISRLRAKLERRGPRVIHTIRGVGYVLHAVPDPRRTADDGSVIELVAENVLDLAPYGRPWPAGGRQ
jgi:DNA-binding response OmpR family regulator